MESQNSIFISHSSRDEKLVTAFIEKILNLGMGIERSKIFYTSNGDTSPKSGKDFRTAIKDKITNASSVIQIITENYKKSEVCLNEMGAAWVLSDNVIPFVVEGFRFESIGFIHSTTQILRLNNSEDLYKFQDEHEELYDGRKLNQTNYHKQVNEFIKNLNERKYESNNYW